MGYNKKISIVIGRLFVMLLGNKKLIAMIAMIVTITIVSSPAMIRIYRISRACSQDPLKHNSVTNQSTMLQYVSTLQPTEFNIDNLYAMNLVENPEAANKLSPLLTKRQDVISEAQRIHMNIFKTLIGIYKYAILFDYSPSENKGDSAIVVGEFILLRKLNIEIIYACPVPCNEYEVNKAYNISKSYTNKDLVILFHGGGNVIGWSIVDFARAREIPRFLQFNIVMFPQSILFTGPKSHIRFCKTLYKSHSRLTFVWRDKTSYKLGKELFPKVRSLLSPDMAYQIGFVPRFMAPTHDILWIKRTDKEKSPYIVPVAPNGFRMHVSDWTKWKTPSGTSQMENTFLMTTNGMIFLQRGRIVVTDRLHGHILSTLLNIPHIYIDNGQRKITKYHRTWTASVEHILFANSSIDALAKAKELLIKLDDNLPDIKGYYTNTG